jgi:prevent-host-death family protein
MTYPLTAAQAHLAELVAEARRSHRPVTISEHGKPVAALINVDDLADLEDRAALAAHLADKAAGRGGVNLEDWTPGWTGSTRKTSGEPDRRLPETALRNLARIRGEDKDLFTWTRRAISALADSHVRRVPSRGAPDEFPGRSMILLQICAATPQRAGSCGLSITGGGKQGGFND